MEILELCKRYFIDYHLILFVIFFSLNILNYILSKKVGSANLSLTTFIIHKLGKWIVILISFLAVFTIRESGDIMGLDFTIISLTGWSVLIVYIIKEMESILTYLIDLGLYVPNVLLKFLNKMEDAIDEEETNN